MDAEGLLKLLSCLGAQIVHIPKGGYILRQGEKAHSFGVMLSGRGKIIRADLQGGHTLIAMIEPTELFAEAIACAAVESLPFSVMACEACTVLMFRHSRIMKGCPKGCTCHSKLITSLLRLISLKNLFLNQKMEIVMRRTTREKLMSYLYAQSRHTGSKRFLIPYDRQGLADFLGVDRSAMSAELSKMKKEGLIDFRKNEFEIL